MNRDKLYADVARKTKRKRLKSEEALLRQKGRASMHKPNAQVVGDIVPGVAAVLRDWLVERATATSKTTNITLTDKLSMIPPRELALMTLQSAVNSAALGEKLSSAVADIGKAINAHLRNADFKQKHRDAHGWVAREIKRRNVSPKYQMGFMNKVAAHKGIELEGITVQERHQAGLLLCQILVEADILKYDTFIKKKGKGLTTIRTVELSDTFKEKAKQATDNLIWMAPISKPMLIKPNDWHGPYSMVYTDVLEPIIKKAENVNDGNQLNLLKKADLSNVLSAINTMQSTPFRVNTKVAEMLRWAWDNDHEIAGLPMKSDLPLPDKPHDIATNEAARLKYKKTKRDIKETNHNSRSERYTIETSLNTVELLKGQPIYFPMQLDFRGRAYPMPTIFQIQAQDYVRAMLEFAEGKVPGERGMYWLKIHGANLWGFDKVSYDERVQWVQEHWDQIVDVSRDPKQVTWWHDADKPWSFLAWCFDVVDAVNGKPSHCRVGMDGSCNGLQHFSAMLRDPVGAKAVNLEPSEKPADVYQQVADVVIQKLKDEKTHKYWADIWRLQVGIDRKICKRAVMVMPYGGKRLSTMNYVEDEAVAKFGGTSPFGDETTKACNYLGGLVYDATREVIVGGKVAMDWLQECVAVASKYNVHVRWTLPHGFVAIQHYVENKEQRIKVWPHGKTGDNVNNTVFTKVWHPTRKLHKGKSVNGISPNFVHSLDACALMMTVNKARERGITSFHMIHDDYSTHAADTQALYECLREAFVELYRDHDVLADFRAELCRQLPRRAQAEVPKVPKKGSFDIEAVLSSPYFFG